MTALVYGVMVPHRFSLASIEMWLTRFCQGQYRFEIEPSPPAVVRVFFESASDRLRFQDALPELQKSTTA